MKLILSTGNIMGAGPPIIRPTTKSNTEFVDSLRSNFHATAAATHSQPAVNGDSNGDSKTESTSHHLWTKQDGSVMEIPVLDFAESALQEERDQYDITLKLFYLPGGTVESREEQTREALGLVFKELGMPSVDLLIVSFPGIYFDEEEDCPDKISTRGPIEAAPEPIEDQVATWKTLEKLHAEGLVKKLGVAEFGYERLLNFINRTDTRPSVNQINLRDCCSVPKDLLTLARSRNVELLVHNDCSNILPRGTVRELLGPPPKGAGILIDSSKAGENQHDSQDGKGLTNGSGQLHGEVLPQWVVKYTAVVKNRGVVENKGYFAIAELTA